MNSLIHSLKKSIRELQTFLTWKKVIPIILLSQLVYVPCEVSSQSKDKKVNRPQNEDMIPDFLENKKTPPYKGKTTARGFHKSIYEKEGWGGPPETITDGNDPFDDSSKEYFYKRIQSHASAKALELNSPALLLSSCQDAAKLTGFEESFRSFINHYLKENSPEENRGRITYNNTSRATHYSCKYGPDENKNPVAKECRGFIKDHGLAVCWPKGESKSWATCECLTYIKVEGGQNKLRTMINYE
jgi:hypothetical protein